MLQGSSPPRKGPCGDGAGRMTSTRVYEKKNWEFHNISPSCPRMAPPPVLRFRFASLPVNETAREGGGAQGQERREDDERQFFEWQDPPPPLLVLGRRAGETTQEESEEEEKALLLGGGRQEVGEAKRTRRKLDKALFKKK